ncbi:hypothetical protein DFQ27_006023 [Actinomortierella ambigua]|uniref:Uncharacterized protein n=1 Tax=Actinomortierella ambigua TaxID=1343610 RepID=A0A9P6Q0B2_9FUNG|nr:hypothetical protein DFQ27_006023 [Actinomortierella ambigua]
MTADVVAYECDVLERVEHTVPALMQHGKRKPLPESYWFLAPAFSNEGAQLNLAPMYENGRGFEQSDTEAVQ